MAVSLKINIVQSVYHCMCVNHKNSSWLIETNYDAKG